MRLLALEAGGDAVSAALFDGAHALASESRPARRRQTEELAPLVGSLLARSGWEPADLGAVACGRGPGSFTGLRSSLAFGTGLAIAAPGLQLVGIPTLEAWAEAFTPAGGPSAFVALDGRRGQVYRALYERVPGSPGRWRTALEPALVDLGRALDEAAQASGAFRITDQAGLPEGWASFGPGAGLALAVGRLALAARAEGTPPGAWEPEYLRRSEAEILWERLHPGPGAGA